MLTHFPTCFSLWKYVLHCCENGHVFLSQVRNQISLTKKLTIRFYVYKMVSLCTVHIWHQPDKNMYVVFWRSTYCTKWKAIHQERYCNYGDINFWRHHKFIYTINKKLSFDATHVRILGTHHCGNTHHETLSIMNTYNMCCVVMIMKKKW